MKGTPLPRLARPGRKDATPMRLTRLAAILGSATIAIGVIVVTSSAAPAPKSDPTMKPDPTMSGSNGGTSRTPSGPAVPPFAKPVPAPTGKTVTKKPLPWIEDFRIAQKRAQKEEKPMLLYFCASDWDDFTIKLDEEVMNTAMWGDWAAQNMLLVK